MRFIKFTITILSLYLIITAAYYITPLYWYIKYEPKEGDIIFKSLPKFDLVEAIEGITESSYSHCGMLIEKSGRWYVREAFFDVHDITLFRWISRGRGYKFSVFRLRPEYTEIIPAFIDSSTKFLGRPYDMKHELDDEKIYCSELIYKSFKDATGEELGKLVPLYSLKWHSYKGVILKYNSGGKPNLDRLLITPRHLSEAHQLEKVFSNNHGNM